MSGVSSFKGCLGIAAVPSAGFEGVGGRNRVGIGVGALGNSLGHALVPASVLAAEPEAE